MGYIVFTYTFHLWGDENENRTATAKRRACCWRKMMPAKSDLRVAASAPNFAHVPAQDNQFEVLLRASGGPFFVRKDDGVWTIPRGRGCYR